MSKIGSLFLLPNTLTPEADFAGWGSSVQETIKSINHYAVEDLRNARRYLRKLDREFDIDSTTFYEMGKHQMAASLPQILGALKVGHNVAVLSESGLPCVADPGNLIVAQAQELGVRVIPFVGPSSIFLALMASGFNGQYFTFHGYLPVKDGERLDKIKRLIAQTNREGSTQIFIETPYRNEAMLQAISKAANPDQKLCVAVDISLVSEQIVTKTIAQWKRSQISLRKRPAIFLLG